jgi:F1F0 ATPase subunit 2
MIKSEYMVMAFIAGIVLGTVFFGGLWLTVKKAVAAASPALWFLASSLIRTGIVLTGFYYVTNGDWQRLVICLLGFIAARFMVIRLTKSHEQKHVQLNKAD